MKKLLSIILTVLIMSTFSVAFADEQEIVESFKTFVSDTMTPIIASYQGEHYSIKYADCSPIHEKSYWYKSTVTTPRYVIDVKKTDSLISPYLGLLDITNDLISYKGKYDSAKEAETSSVQESPFMLRHNRYTYAYQDGNWVKIRVEYERDGIWNDETMKNNPDSYMCRDEVRK